MLGIGAFPALLQAVVLLFLPESPRWYVKVGRIEQATDSLLRLRTPYGKPRDESTIAIERTAIQLSLNGQEYTAFCKKVKQLFQSSGAAAKTGIGLHVL
jgi:SP family myo-inositol transporter-like MFS transporter 13